MFDFFKKLFRKKEVWKDDGEIHLHSDSMYPYSDMHKIRKEAEKKEKPKNKQLDEDAIRKAGW